MTTVILQEDIEAADHRRMVALTVELVRRGELPAFYVSPPVRNRLERDLQRKLSSELSGIATRVLDGLDGGTLRFGNADAITAILGPDAEIVTEGVAAAFEPSFEDAARTSFNREALSIFRGSGIELNWDIVQPQAREVLKNHAFTASKKLIDRVVFDVNATLLDGFDQGLGTREVGRNLRGLITNLKGKEAELIARTEINSAGNTGNFIALKTAQVEYIQWITAVDGRVRPTHMNQHAMVVKTGDRFPNHLLHPGDRSGDIGEWINCRCAGVAYFPTQGELLLDTPYTGSA